MELPKFIGLKSLYNNKYLSYIHEDSEVHALLHFSGDVAVSGYAKFEVEQDETGNGLVHIRSVYNNKCWARLSTNHQWIAANVDEPDEDQSKWSCTLFEPILVDGGGANGPTIRLRHVEQNRFVCISQDSPPYDSCLYAGSTEPNGELLDVFQIFDWNPLFILPKHITFKSNNGCYLKGEIVKGQNYLTFTSTDIGSSAVAHEVLATATGDGSVVGIKSVFFGKYWKRSESGWVLADSSNINVNDSNTLLMPTKVSGDVVGLCNVGNKLFCKRLTKKKIVNGLSAFVPTITEEAKIQVHELVASREIENTEFHLVDGRIYDKNVITIATGIVENRLQQPAVMDVTLSYDDTSISTWNSTVSVELDVQTSIKSSIPIFYTDILAIYSEFSGEYKWGETKNLTKKVEVVHKVRVEPMSKVTVNLLATQVSCDVPFSYTQKDTLLNGQTITLNMKDGIYKGINLYNFRFETQSSPL